MAATMTTNLLNNRDLIKYFAAFNITLTAASGGAAIGMYLFSIPLIATARPFSSKIMLRQFHHLISNGQKYLQSASRTGTITMAALTWLAYRHPDHNVHQSWIYFAAASMVRLQAAWYEVVYIFPINDTLIDVGKQLEKADDEDNADRAMRSDVIEKLEQWRTRHIGRILIPFIAVAVMFGGLSL